MINSKLGFAVLAVVVASLLGAALGVVIWGGKGLWLFPAIFLALPQVELIFLLHHTLRSFRQDLPLLKKVFAGLCLFGILGGFVVLLGVLQHGLILRLG